MPQVFQVLCCYNCDMFQVDQVKKLKKWQCKICNEKQSFKKAFKIGLASDCRSLVQDLNMQKAMRKLSSFEEREEAEDSIHEEYVSGFAENIEKGEHKDQPTLESDFEDDSCFLVSENNTYEDSFSDETRRCGQTTKTDRIHIDVSAPDIDDCCQESVQTSNYIFDDNRRILEILEEENNYEPEHFNIYKESQKCSLSTNANPSPQSFSAPPVKKNRGFQLIKNAASKLN